MPMTMQQQQVWLEERFREGWDNPDSLHPELRPAYAEIEGVGKTIRHPLVYQVWYFNAWEANAMYEWKLDVLKEYEAECNWFGYVWAHERPYRMEALATLHWSGHDVLRELLIDTWQDQEAPWQIEKLALDLFNQVYDPNELYTDSEAPVKLPATMTIYRGQDDNASPELGMSWTRSQKVAEWFSRRYVNEPVVYRAKVKREHVLAYVVGRDEKEIVVDPAELTHVVRLP